MQTHNILTVGFNRSAILDFVPRQQFLFIDDEIPPLERRAKVFDPARDSFNPLKDMDHIRAEQFVNVLDAIFPEGASTLTRRYSNFILFKQLLDKPRRLSDMVTSSKDPYQRDASERIERLLLSPVLERVLNGRTNFSTSGTIYAPLPRATMGSFDAFVLGNLLINQYPATVILPDFGFFAHPGHVSLIQQNRLIAGIGYFDEVPALKRHLVQIVQKVGSHTTLEDAEVLAGYAGIPTVPEGRYRDFIEKLTRA